MDFSKVSTAFVLFPSGDADQSILKNTAEYQGLVSNGSIQRTEASAIPSEGQFDLVFGLEANIKNNEDALFTILKPDGQLAAAKNAPVQGLSFSLKIAGFVAGVEDANVSVYRKPAYEMGSSVQVDKKNVWSLDDNMDDDDLINDEDLLDEQDKQKPNAEDLRVCATTKQRKACANCSCGLKEELEADEVVKVRENSQNAKSSCGNCYLGDAFRCAACPYRGIPAFKPGEKVTIDVGNDEI